LSRPGTSTYSLRGWRHFEDISGAKDSVVYREKARAERSYSLRWNAVQGALAHLNLLGQGRADARAILLFCETLNVSFIRQI